MVVTEKRFHEIADMYSALINKFFEVHNIEKVVCTDENEHFFDRIDVVSKDKINVYSHGLVTPFSGLLFDFTCDYAKCLSDMEHDLYLQERDGNHEKYTFYFKEK